MNAFTSFLKFVGLAILNVLTMFFGKPEDMDYVQKYTAKIAVAA